MKLTIRLLAASLPLLAASCATEIGRWPAADFTYAMSPATLRGEVKTSLEKQGWSTYPGDMDSDVRGIKASTGGHRTVADFHIVPSGKGSAFELTAGSHHVVNWLSFGILGLSTQAQAHRAINRWIEDWNRSHPK